MRPGVKIVKPRPGASSATRKHLGASGLRLHADSSTLSIFHGSSAQAKRISALRRQYRVAVDEINGERS